MKQDDNAKLDTPTKARLRSPNYPSISLKAAVEKIGKWYKVDGPVASTREAALAHMGFEKLTGNAGRLLSALKSFGLVQETEGRIKLTQRGIDIAVRPEGDPKRVGALKEAALGPQIYSDLLKEYPQGLPSDTTLSSELIAGKAFNPKAVDDFIKDFRETLVLAGISNFEGVKLNKQEQNGNQGDNVKVDDYVQWESKGILQFGTATS